MRRPAYDFGKEAVYGRKQKRTYKNPVRNGRHCRLHSERAWHTLGITPFRRSRMINKPIKQRNIFIRELESLTNDIAVSGVLLTGSVACGCASENSDIDIIVLCDRHCFETHFTDGILVETSFVTYEYAVEKLGAEPMDVYHYLDAEIALDRDGRLSEIMAIAKQKYENYRTPQKVRNSLYHWLMTVKIKLETADALKKRYLAHINAWKVLEAVWAVNNKPMPPAGTAYRKRGELQTVPCENWFEKLFSEDCCGTMSEIIDFLLPILN